MNANRTSDTRLTPLNVGTIPDGWNVSKIDQLASRVTNGYVGPVLEHQTMDAADKVRYLQGFNVRPNRIELINESYVSAEFDRAHPKSRLEENDILTVQSGHIGTTARVPKELVGSNCHALIITRPRPELIDSRYLTAYLNSHIGQARMRGLHVGSSIVHINTSELAEFRVPVPPLPEQRKIADILTTWDEALTQLDALIEAQERRKKALMQQLLTGRRRLRPHGISIKHLKASEIFTNRSERNTEALPVLSVTQDQGIVLRCSLERRIAHDEDNINTYKVVRAGDYVISLRSFQGGLEFSEVTGAVSPAYHVIRPIKEIDQSFYRNYFKSVDFISRLATATIGIRDGKQISFTDFGFIKLPYPAIEDQKGIGVILDTADQQLTLLRTQRTALDQQKRGLMQRLLTGKLRVKTA